MKIKHLSVELWMAILISLISAIFIFLVTDYCSDIFIESSAQTEYYVNRQQDIAASNLQKYVKEKHLSRSDMKAIDEWTYDKPLLYLSILDDNTLLYDNTILGESYIFNNIDEVDSLDDTYQESHFSRYTLSLSDKDVVLYLYGEYAYLLSTRLQLAAFLIAVIVFIAVLTLLIRKKIQYINELNQGILILEGGNLEYPLPVNGYDEVASVATSLNSMRRSLKQQMERERKALMANSSLVTALSHDLRTPLTTQMGYLEIIKEHHYENDAQLNQYISTCLATCGQIKDMSDRLFEYFLAFDSNPERTEDVLEYYDGLGVFMQLILEHTLLLEEKGFSFEIKEPEIAFQIRVNINDMERIFHNIFSNIEKYADEKTTIAIHITQQEEQCTLSFTNSVRKTPRKNESSKIGLETIHGLMRRQYGTSTVKSDADSFTLQLMFPISQA